MIHHQHRRAGQEQKRRQANGNEPENQWQWHFFEPAQAAADFFLQLPLLLEQMVFVGRKIGFGPIVIWRKQPPELSAAAERPARGPRQLFQRAGTFGRGAAEIFQRDDGAGQRVVPAALGVQRAGLIFEFPPPVLFADFIHHLFPDGGVGAIDPGLAVVVIGLKLPLPLLKRGIFAVNVLGQFRRPFTSGFVGQLVGGGGLGAKSVFSFFSRAAKSRITFFNAFSSATISLTPGCLFTMFAAKS